MKRIPLAVATTAAATAVLVATPQLAVRGRTGAGPGTGCRGSRLGRLTNLAHLDFLGDDRRPAARRTGHTTYQLDSRPDLGVLWTYADQPGRRFLPARRWRRRTTPRPTPTGQGAYNADDMARAAVVYLRHWRPTGAASSRHAAVRRCCAG